MVPGIVCFNNNDTLISVLALPVLWASFAQQIQQTNRKLQVLDAAINPAQRALLIFYQIQERVYIDETFSILDADGKAISHHQQQRGRNVITQDHINGIFIQLQQK